MAKRKNSISNFIYRCQEAKITPYSGTYNANDAKYELDYAYRVIADHTRMCAVCIADGMYPQTKYA